MSLRLLDSRFAVIGGGPFCKIFLECLLDKGFRDHAPDVLGVADVNQQAEGVQYAREMGLFTTPDYREFYHFKDLQFLPELTMDPPLADEIRQTTPPAVELIDHIEARSLWTAIQLEKEKKRALYKLRQHPNVDREIELLFRQFADHITDAVQARNTRYVEIEREFLRSQMTLSQIIQGSTMPTFDIDENHRVTHWNRALEKLTGYAAREMVGSRKQWAPFYSSERPSLADVILKHAGEDDLPSLYGRRWQKSALIEGAYEAEIFFPSLGEGGKWCWFTAAPIKSPDGRIIGAIETLWDKTEDKKAEQERERHTHELQTLCKVYSALNDDIDVEARIDRALDEVQQFMAADNLCIYLMEDNSEFSLRRCHFTATKASRRTPGPEELSIIRQVAQSGEFLIREDRPAGPGAGRVDAADPKQFSLAFIPITSKERTILGVIRMATGKPRQFSLDQKHVLELIGNRIGAALENARLQDQYIKSQEKYQTLFNSDPHPIFILDRDSYRILDINKRVRDSYGYTDEELLGTAFPDLCDKDDDELVQGLKHMSDKQSLLLTKKRNYRKGGRPFYVNIIFCPARYGDSDAVIVATTDISESVEKETQLIQASKMTTIGQMAAGMAHEINQPLNVIQVCSDLLDKMIHRGIAFSTEEMASIARDIRRNVQRASGVIQHVRDFSRQSEMGRHKVNINYPIRDVFKVLGHQLSVHQVDLTLDLCDQLPWILADHNRLEQVFINLVTNAMDALDEKRNHPEYGNTENRLTIRSFVDGGQVVVTVADTGIGMTEEVQGKLFDPFFTTKKVGKGTGLGVSISYGIIKDYDGQIDITSQRGKGTTFELRFPAFHEDKNAHV
ncbi:MAG: PAS domain S-box protein [Desulfosarcina sp.]|nr:PAS domain S-box protein [Desulfobacterales bacterium]